MTEVVPRTLSVFAKYCVAGSVAAAVHFAVLILLVEGLSVLPTAASAVGFCVAVSVNYVLQYHWTFSATGSHGIAFVKFSAIACFALSINTGVFWLAHEALGVHYVVAQAFAITLVVLVNFTMNRRYVFASDVPK